MKISYFKNTSNGFNYNYEETIPAGETVLLKMPPVTPNKRGVNDIGFMVDERLTIYATIAASPDTEDANVWQEIQPYDEINKTTSYLKIVNSSESSGEAVIRVILF